jgi:uncharacterized oxidoreductase
MDLKKANVLITGGSDGIGKGLAKRFLDAGSKVLITGRNPDRLKQAADENPGLLTFVNDIGDATQRESLAAHIRSHLPDLNILINNAGIQRRIALADDHAPWQERQAEINILLSGPIHLNDLLIPILLNAGQPGMIVNVTSGGAYIPQVFAPVYSACKAALHSYTMTLRHALKDTPCRVIELIPPAVQTSLAGPGMNHGAPLDEFCDKVFKELTGSDKESIGFGPTDNLIQEISGQPLQNLFSGSAARFPVHTYKQK